MIVQREIKPKSNIMNKNRINREKGNFGERIARMYALKHGMEILKNNYHSRYGEVDLIFKDGDTLAFTEVKLRDEKSVVSGVESIGQSKRRKIIKTACDYIQKNDIGMQIRFDVAEIRCNTKMAPARIKYIKNAFGVEGLNEFF